MSLVTVLGVSASFIFSISLVPVVAGLLIRKSDPFNNPVLETPDILMSDRVPPVRD
jgi:hypothetical protein